MRQEKAVWEAGIWRNNLLTVRRSWAECVRADMSLETAFPAGALIYQNAPHFWPVMAVTRLVSPPPGDETEFWSPLWLDCFSGRAALAGLLPASSSLFPSPSCGGVSASHVSSILNSSFFLWLYVLCQPSLSSSFSSCLLLLVAMVMPFLFSNCLNICYFMLQNTIQK